MYLLLDLDGTLIDSSPGIFHSFSLACYSLGLKTPAYASFSKLIGPPVQHIARSLYPELDIAALECFRKIFRDDYDHHSYRNANWYPGVIDTLNLLSSDPGLHMIIVTNKPTRPSEELIKSAGIHSCFVDIFGVDYRLVHATGSIFASKSEALSYVLSSTPIHASQSLYLGDTPSDQEACSRSQVPFVAALYGFHKWGIKDRPAYSLECFGDIHGVLDMYR